MKRPVLPFIVLFIGVLIASTSAILITAAINLGVTPLSVAAGRITLASLIITPFVLLGSREELLRMSQRDLILATLSGLSLAAHFATWISSLAYTSVASSTALVTTNPVFVALVTWLVFRQRLAWGTWLGILITVMGSGLIAFSDRSGSGTNPLLGDLLALMGAMSVSGYFLLGRHLRSRISLLPYIWIVYSTSALALLLLMLLMGHTLIGLPPLGYLLILGLALGPQLLGHTAFNWVIKYLSPTLVTVAILGEPIGSALMAIFFFNQPLMPLQITGGLILLVGIGVTILAERPAKPTKKGSLNP